MKFTELDLNRKLLRALEECGYEEATPIQAQTIKAFKQGKNVVGQSQTGSGKTAAFVLPLLEAINTRIRKPQVLILAPTRELAVQTRQEIFQLSKHMRMASLFAVGGTSKRKQKRILKKGPQIVVGTPGRVQDLIDSGDLKLDAIEYFVLDEVDRMLDMGFIDDIRRIWDDLSGIKQSLTFSATLPKEAKQLIDEVIGDEYEHIKISEEVVVDQVDHMFVNLGKQHKFVFLKELLQSNPDFKVLVFTETKKGVDQLAEKLNREGFEADALHGDMDQRERFSTLKTMRKDNCRVLVATDVAARGLNMNEIHLVINYKVPTDPESYIHRIGRTARAGKKGNALMLVSDQERDDLHRIERRNDIKIRQVSQVGEPMKRSDRPSRKKKKRSGRRKYKKSRKKNKRR